MKPELEHVEHKTICVDGKVYNDVGVLIDDTNFNEATGQFRDDDPPAPFHPQKFSANDGDEVNTTAKALRHLEEYGYVVWKDVVSADELNMGIDLFWKHLKEKRNIDRDDITTWGDDVWPGDLSNGVIADIIF
jgi:hypothetical protein